MSSNPDKTIFAGAFALTVASGAFFLIGAEAPTVSSVSVAHSAPSTVEIPNVIQPLSVWEAPNPQKPLDQDKKVNRKQVPFVLHVFNSPKLYYKAPFWTLSDGDPLPPPFPFELKDIYQKPFRIQFGSYVEAGGVTVYLKDLERKTDIKAIEGDRLTDPDVTIKSVKIEEVTINGGINRVGVVEIVDNKSRRTYKLVEKEPEVKEPTWFARVRDITTKKDTEVVLDAKLVNDSVTYTVKTLDKSSDTISLEFLPKLGETKETEILKKKP